MAKESSAQAMNVNDDQNVVLEGSNYDAGIIPRTKREMWRRVSLRSEVRIGGPVFCGTLEIHNGPCTIEESVFAKNDITITLGRASGRSVIRGCVQAERSLLVKGEHGSTTDRLIVVGDTYAGTVNLTNTVVYGNVYCDTGVVRDSLVVGNVVARVRLEAERAIVGSYLTRSVELGERCRLLHPYAASENEPTMNGQLEFLITRSDGSDAPATVPLYPTDVAESTIDSQEHDDIKPRYMVGIGSALLNASALVEPMFESADAVAERLAAIVASPGNGGDSEWEEAMLSLCPTEVNRLSTDAFSLADLPLLEDAVRGLLSARVQGPEEIDELARSDDEPESVREE